MLSHKVIKVNAYLSLNVKKLLTLYRARDIITIVTICDKKGGMLNGWIWQDSCTVERK